MKRLLMLSIVMMTMVNTFAQWQPDDKQKTRLDDPNAIGQVDTHALRTPEGRTVLTWLRWTDSSSADFSNAGYHLHLQILDVDGSPLFGTEGVLVDTNATPSYTTGYGLALASNGDILMAYPDAREDIEECASTAVYVYRYDQQGNSVWSPDGVKMEATIYKNKGDEMAPIICTNGDNIYVGLHHSEIIREKADENNWQPNPWFPNEPMPDSIEVNYDNFQLQRFRDDGTAAWSENLVVNAQMAVFQPCGDSDIFLIYNSANMGLEAQRINSEGENVWQQPVTIEEESISGGLYMPTPETVVDDEGGVVLTYRKIAGMTGYQVMTRLSANGQVLNCAVSCNGSTEGDALSGMVATRGDKVLVAWEYDKEVKQMYLNLLGLDGRNVWNGTKKNGLAISKNRTWGFTPVKIIPQTDGWVLLYGNCTSWDGANFMVFKIDDNGNKVWSKQIAENGMKSSGFSVVNDEHYAYIFFTQEEDYDDNWNPIPDTGGLFVMCVDIAPNNGEDGIRDISNDHGREIHYDLNGRELTSPTPKGLYIVRHPDGTATKKITNP